MTSLEDINDPTKAINAAFILFAKAFQLTAPTNNNQRTLSNPCNHRITQLVMNMSQDRQTQNVGGNGGNQFGQYAGKNAGVQNGGNQNGLVVVPGIANQNGIDNIVAARAEGTGNRNQDRCYNYKGLGDLDEIKEVNANSILMANLQQASTSGTQLDKAPVYNTDDSTKVNQSFSGIFINQTNYVIEILEKYGLNTCDIIGTLMDIKDKLDLDQIETLIDATKYHSMIGALMYLTSSRPDIVHATCVCARYQSQPTEKYLKEVKRIFRYLWGTINMGL
nr:uncharacterized mitochondrial protein AtMg00810-like [Tanacetum cinerariifolium]